MSEIKDKQKEAPESGVTDKAETAPSDGENTSASSIMGMEADQSAEADKSRGRRRPTKSIPAGIAYVKSTFNNTLVSITDARGNVISWGSAGRSGFKGSRKCTAFSATMVAQDAARQAMAKGMHEVEVRVQGAGAGRESAVRAIQSAGITVSNIKDTTPIPHNGCRPRKRRRV